MRTVKLTLNKSIRVLLLSLIISCISCLAIAGDTSGSTTIIEKSVFPPERVRPYLLGTGGFDNRETWGIVKADNNSPALKKGESLYSANKKYVLRLQNDGNLCKYKVESDNRETFKWCSMKYNYGQNSNTNLRLQSDGNLVVYKDNGSNPVWALNLIPGNRWSATTSNNSNILMILYDSGEILIFDDANRVIWSEETK